MRKTLHSMIAAVALVAAAGALAACNTMAGAGQDMQEGGQALTGSAEKHGATMAPTDQSAPAPSTDTNAPASQ